MATQRVYAEPQRGHVSLGKPLRGILFVLPIIPLAVVLHSMVAQGTDKEKAVAAALGIACAVVWGIVVSGLRVAAQWERGVVLRLGRFTAVRGPGVLYIIPFIDNVRFVDLRLLTLNIPSQQVITKDNVPAAIDGVLFYLVADP
jgi:regulator of protease activity HflC (stomatin/prohibitin superfamily)